MYRWFLPVSTHLVFGTDKGQLRLKNRINPSRSNGGLRMLRKKWQRIVIRERKISVLRLDACHSVQALSCQKEKTISVLSALTSARGS
jgi:hypothetical protein